MSNFRLAISFLTILPLYGRRVAGEKEMARSLYYYSLVGFIIGSLLMLAAHLALRVRLGAAGDALIIALWMILTGGLHLDGLMDSADGLFSGRDRARKLEIMKDSRVGAMGAMALLVVILLKVSLLTILPYPLKYWALLCAPALGRSMMVFAIVFLPYARKEAGLGRAFGSEASKAAFPLGLIISLFAAFSLGGADLLVPMLAAALLAVMAALWINRILEGHTGDTYGALCETGETLFLISIAIYLGF